MPFLPSEIERLILSYVPARNVTPALLAECLAQRSVARLPVACVLCNKLPSIFCFLSPTPLMWLYTLPVAIVCRDCAVQAPVYVWNGRRGIYRRTRYQTFDAAPNQILNIPNHGFLMPVLY